MDIARHLTLTAPDGGDATPQRLFESWIAAPEAGASSRLIVLHGATGNGKSLLLRWIAARLAARAREPGNRDGEVVLLDLRAEPVDAWDAAAGLADASTLWWSTAARQAGAWAAALRSEGAAPSVWLLDHVDALDRGNAIDQRPLKKLLRAAAEVPGLKVLACSTVFWRQKIQPEIEWLRLIVDPIDVTEFEVGGLSTREGELAWITAYLADSVATDAARVLELVENHPGMERRPKALEVAVRFLKLKGMAALEEELKSRDAGQRLLDDYVLTLWHDRMGPDKPLPPPYRRILRHLCRILQTDAATKTDTPSITHHDAEAIARLHTTDSDRAIEDLLKIGVLEVAGRGSATAYRLPWPSFAGTYLRTDDSAYPGKQRPNENAVAFGGQLIRWFLLQPDAWQRHLVDLGVYEPTATLPDLVALRSAGARRIVALLAALPPTIGLVVWFVLGLASGDWAAAAIVGACALVVSAAGGLVLALTCSVAFAFAYMLFAGVIGCAVAGAAALGSFTATADVLASSQFVGSADLRLNVVLATCIALAFTAGLKGFWYQRPPRAQVRSRLLSIAWLPLALTVVTPLAYLVAARVDSASPSTTALEITAGAMAALALAAAAHWRHRRPATTALVGALSLAGFAFCTVVTSPPWDLFSVGARSAFVWTSLFALGYVVLRDLVFPFDVSRRFTLHEGSQGAMASAFGVGFVGLSLVTAVSSADPPATLLLCLGLVILGTTQRFWRAAVGTFLFAPWDLPMASRTGRIERHSSSWDGYHEFPRLGLSQALERAVDRSAAAGTDTAERYLVYFSDGPNRKATVRGWQRFAVIQAAACRDINDVIGRGEPQTTHPVMVQTLRECVPGSVEARLVEVAVGFREPTDGAGVESAGRLGHVECSLSALATDPLRSRLLCQTVARWADIINAWRASSGTTQ